MDFNSISGFGRVERLSLSDLTLSEPHLKSEVGKISLYIVILSLLVIGSSSGSMIKYSSQGELKAEAEIVVTATILSAELDSTSFCCRIFKYQILIDSFEKGKLDAREYIITFNDFIPHKRGKTSISPLKNGSGIESNLIINGYYRLYLRSEKYLEILLAEEVKKPKY